MITWSTSEKLHSRRKPQEIREISWVYSYQTVRYNSEN